MDGLAVSTHAGLFEGFRKGRVGMASTSQILGTGSVFDPDHCLSNHLPGSWSHDVGSEKPVRLLVGQDLDHAVGV